MKYFLDTEFLEGKQKGINTIDLISIGIVCENGSEYYAISKEFNLKAAWKDEWIRNNVLLPIYKECVSGDQRNRINFSLSGMKYILKRYGKTRKHIQSEIIQFTLDNDKSGFDNWTGSSYEYIEALKNNGIERPEFYAYYADYDWVVFCWLFGRMIDLPETYPMFCIDLKQMIIEKGLDSEWKNKNCPDPEGEHNALVDARWNMKLYEALN